MTKQQKAYFEELVELSEKDDTFKQRTVQSLNWFRNKVRQVFGSKDIPPDTFFDKRNYPNAPIPGNIVTFKYFPRTINTIPYYDMFPLVLVLKLAPGGFIGLNFHYLHPMDRAHLMGKLQKYMKVYADGTIRINIRYDVLKRSVQLVHHKPCIRRYYKAGIKTMFYTLMPNEWDIALFLPTEKFIQTRKQRIWEQSRTKIEQLKNKFSHGKSK